MAQLKLLFQYCAARLSALTSWIAKRLDISETLQYFWALTMVCAAVLGYAFWYLSGDPRYAPYTISDDPLRYSGLWNGIARTIVFCYSITTLLFSGWFAKQTTNLWAWLGIGICSIVSIGISLFTFLPDSELLSGLTAVLLGQISFAVATPALILARRYDRFQEAQKVERQQAVANYLQSLGNPKCSHCGHPLDNVLTIKSGPPLCMKCLYLFATGKA